MIYLASPYSHDDPSVRELRFQAACRATAELINQGHVVFSPIVYGHPLTKHGVATEWTAWESFARKQIAIADEMLVLCVDGWEDSAGIREEIYLAEISNTPIDSLSPRSIPALAKWPCSSINTEPRR